MRFDQPRTFVLVTSAAISKTIRKMVTGRCPAVLSVVALLIATVGCEPPPRPTKAKKKAQNDRLLQLPEEDDFQEVDTTDGELPLRFAVDAPFELWEAHFLGGEQIGYAHLQAERTDQNGEVRYRYTERMKIRRGDQLFDSELSQTSIEDLQGRLKQFDAVLLNNSQKTLTTGTVAQNKLNLVVRREGEPETTRQVNWQPSHGGLLAVQQHLREKPMARGDKRELTVLAPVIYEPSTLLLEAIGIASVSMLTGESRTLLEVEVTPVIQGTEGPKTTLWTDDQGNILKQYIPTYGLIIVRTDQETATQHFSPQNDVLATFQIPLDKSMDNRDEVTKSLFLVSSKSGRDLTTILIDQPGQFARASQQGEQSQQGPIEIAVFRDADAEVSTLQPDDADRRSGPLVQSNDPLVRAIASVATPDTKPALAKKLARTVYDHIDQKDNSEGFASAAFVASTGRGDCTEHAVLLAALCRAKGIPARVAAGLVYHESADGPSMRYHMWTLAYADDRWIQLDATRPSGLAPADRIIITTDNLASGSEYAVVQAVSALLGDLSIQLQSTINNATPSSDAQTSSEREDAAGETQNSAPANDGSSANALRDLLEDN